MGRNTAIQTHIKAQIEKKNIQQSASITADTPVLQDKAENLKGYVVPFKISDDIVEKILLDNSEIEDKSNKIV